MARTRSRSVKSIPIVKIQEDDEIIEEPISLKRAKNLPNSLIHQLTREKLESLKPSCKHKTTGVKKDIPDKIRDINELMQQRFPSNNEFESGMDLLNKYKFLSNFNIDIKTLNILRSGIEEHSDHDLKLKKALESNDLTKLYELYEIEPPIIPSEQNSINETQDEISFL